jgi:HlyD family secretion protein
MFRWLKVLKTLSFWQVVMALVVMAGSGGGVYAINLKLNNFKQVTPTVTTQLVAVRYGDVSQTLTVSGTLSYSEITQLNFGAAGTIKKVNITDGDSVIKGDILAEFDDASLRSLQKQYVQAQVALTTAQDNLDTEISQAQVAVTNAQIALKTAQDNLEKAEHPYSDTEISQAQVAVTNAQIALKTAQDNLDKAQHPYTTADIAQAELAITNANIALNTAKDNLYKAEHPYTDEEIAAAEQAVKDAEQALDNAYTKASIDYVEASNAVTEAYAAYLAANSAYPPGDPRIAKAQLAVERAELNLESVKYNITQNIKSAEEKIQAAKDKLAAMKEPPDPLNIQQKQQMLVVAQNNLAQVKSNLSDMQAGTDQLNVLQKQQQLTLADNNLSQAKTNLTKILVEPDATTIKLSQIELQNAQAAIIDTEKQLQLTSLKAPFSGIVTTVNIKVGQVINASTVAIEMIDPSVFALTASVNELDITQVKVGQSASVSVDALFNQKLSGKVKTIARSATTQSGVVSYKVTTWVTAPSNGQLRAGMSATADITTQQSMHVLIVPNKAVGGTTSNPTVVVAIDGQEQTKSVKTGLSDSSYTEITEGLQEGDMVQISSTVRTTSTSRTSTTTRTSNITQIPGGNFPGGGFPGAP